MENNLKFKEVFNFFSVIEELPQTFRVIEERCNLVSDIAVKIGIEPSSSTAAIQSKLMEALNELDGYKNSNKFRWNGEIKELKVLLDTLVDHTDTLEAYLADVERAKNDCESAAQDIGYAQEEIHNVISGIEEATNGEN